MKAEKEEIAEEPFVIRPYLKSDLAHLYNPYVPLVYAMRKMREWIRNNKELYDAMYSGGEGKNDHAYSARQVRLIVRYLDEPWISLGQVLISYNENKISYNEIEISYNENRISYNEIKISYNENKSGYGGILSDICFIMPALQLCPVDIMMGLRVIYGILRTNRLVFSYWMLLVFLFNNVHVRRRERIFFLYRKSSKFAVAR